MVPGISWLSAIDQKAWEGGSEGKNEGWRERGRENEREEEALPF